MKRWLHRITLVGVAFVGIVAGGATAAQADSGWLYTTEPSSINRGYYHTAPGGDYKADKLTVCDNNGSDGKGTIAVATLPGTWGYSYHIEDSLDNGNCVYLQDDLFPDGEILDFKVCHYYGHVFNWGDALVDCAYTTVWS